jgi:hypothetical protein
MTDQSIEAAAVGNNAERLLFEMALKAHCHYIRASSIVEKTEHGGRIFYSRFRRLDSPPNHILVSQHLRGEITMALPLLHENRGDKIVIEYLGNETERFRSTLEYLLGYLRIGRYHIFRGKRPAKHIIMIQVRPTDIETLHRLGSELSGMLQTRLPKLWKILPDRRLPENHNIFTLPYGYIN